jgi:hypothetical protein
MNVRGRQQLDDGILRQAIISLHEIAQAEYFPVSLCTQKPWWSPSYKIARSNLSESNPNQNLSANEVHS